MGWVGGQRGLCRARHNPVLGIAVEAGKFRSEISVADDLVENPSVIAGFSMRIESTGGCWWDPSGGVVIAVLR